MLAITRGNMTENLSDGLLNVNEAAKQLDLSASTVRRLIELKEIRALRLGRKKIRIERQELVRYLERQKSQQ